MTMPVLVLLTASYPFEQGEEFLELEIEYLAREFEQICIVPIQSASGASRGLPHNAVVLPDFIQQRNKKPQGNICGFFHLDFWGEFLRHLPRSLSKDAFCALWRWSAKAHKLEKWLKFFFKENFSRDTPVVFFSYWVDYGALALSRFVQKYSQKTIVARIHGYDLYDERNPIAFFPYRKKIFSALRELYFLSQDGMDYIQKKYPCFVHKYVLARRGTLYHDFSSASSCEAVFRVVSCSFFRPVKRIDLLIRAIRCLADHDFAVEWVHIGDGPLRTAMHAFASQRLDGKVKWAFTGYLSNKDVYEFYRKHPVDVFINVSASEGLPVSILEAQSFGIPVIATAVGGTPEVVSNKNGCLLPPDPSPEQISAALVSFAQNKANAKEKRIQSRKDWEQAYQADQNYSWLSRHIASLASPA